jgi:hypothetical protein
MGKSDGHKTQSDRFIEAARALGCDEDKERFEATLGKIAVSAHKLKSGAKNANAKHKGNPPK